MSNQRDSIKNDHTCSSGKFKENRGEKVDAKEKKISI